jgi:hypothetical protein
LWVDVGFSNTRKIARVGLLPLLVTLGIRY